MKIAALLAAVTFLGTAMENPHAAAADDAVISLDVRDVDIYDTVRLLATQANANVVVDSSVQHRNVTIRLRRIRFSQALSTLAQANDLEAIRIGKVVYLGASDVMNRRYPSSPAYGNVTRILSLKNASPDDVVRNLTDGLPKGTVILGDKRTASVVVSGSRSAVDRAAQLAQALDAGAKLPSIALPMHFTKASAVVDALKATLAVAPPSSLYASDVQNAVILVGPSDFLAQASALIAKLDRPGAQVRYDVRVTDVTPQSDTGNVGP